MPEAAGFWSYARHDDHDAQGRIRQLATLIRLEYSLITGSEIEIFVDRDSLQWGDEWRRRIDEALAATTFFIPIITPRFFASTECRRELVTFAGHARSLGVEELLLPILYAPVPELEPDAEPEDEVMRLVAARQREDWREMRLEDETAAVHRRRVNNLAVRLAEIAHDVAERPVSVTTAGTTEADDEDDGEPGLLEQLATTEETFPRWRDTIEQLGDLLASLNEAGTEVASELDRRGDTASARLAIVRRFARRLQEPAEELLELGRRYAADLVDIDPGILAILRLAESQPDEAGSPDVLASLASIKLLVTQSRAAVESLAAFVEQLRSQRSLSRELRRPFSQMEEGLSGVLDGQAVLDEWGRRIDRLVEQLGVELPPVEGTHDEQDGDEGEGGSPQ